MFKWCCAVPDGHQEVEAIVQAKSLTFAPVPEPEEAKEQEETEEEAAPRVVRKATNFNKNVPVDEEEDEEEAEEADASVSRRQTAFPGERLTVTVTKAAPSDALNMVVESVKMRGGDQVKVISIKEGGAVAKYNAANPKAKIEVGDVLEEINGQTKALAIVKELELGSAQELTMLIVRTRVP